MLIRTQNRKTLVKLDNFLAIQITEEKNNAVIKERVAGVWGPLGEYSNCKKAMKVLDMIQESYVLYNAACAGLAEHTVFQMPQDDEVEI